MDAKPLATIENWSLVSSDPYQAPELSVPRLHGDVRNHYRIGDRNSQTTSRILGKTKEGHIVTCNTAYIIGAVDSEYEKLFPGAKERLLKQLPELEVILLPSARV